MDTDWQDGTDQKDGADRRSVLILPIRCQDKMDTDRQDGTDLRAQNDGLQGEGVEVGQDT